MGDASPRWRTAVSAGLVVASCLSLIVVAAGQRAVADSAVRSTVDDFLSRPGEETGPARLTYEGPMGSGELVDGGVVPLADDVGVQVSVVPFPPNTFDVVIQLVVLVDGQPVGNAVVTADYDMAVMWHGPFPITYEYASGQRLSAELDLFMFGPWEVAHTVALPGRAEIEFTLAVYVWPE